jgi:hypothetical protein
MFYHVHVELPSIHSWFAALNVTSDQVLQQWICPFIMREPILQQDQLFNVGAFGGIRVFGSERVVDSDWPVKRGKEDEIGTEAFQYERALQQWLLEHGENVMQDLVREALVLTESGAWQARLKKRFEQQKGRSCFFICPFGNAEVDNNYRVVIKPQVERHQFDIERVDEISHSKMITEVILSRIARARLVVADLTDARPNCYYEVGYAHSLGKPVILLAKEGTERHFDIAAYQWNYWRSYDDLLDTFDKAIRAAIRELGLSAGERNTPL